MLKLMNHAKQFEKENSQNFVWSPLALNTARKCRGMLKMRVESFWSGISRQISKPTWVSSATFVGGLSILFNPREVSDHRFSIGFKYGDIAVQSMCCTISSSRKSMTCRARCAEALSSWNTNLSRKSLLANRSILVPGTRMHWYWSMFPSSTWSWDFPLLWQAAHIVIPPPPVCTLGSTRSSSIASWACQRTRSRSSWRYSNNLNSSLKTKCCQWPSHQSKCPRKSRLSVSFYQ